MIRVTKPQQPPTVLRNQGAKATKRICDAFDKCPAEYCCGAKLFKFNARIYGAKSVKTVLRKAQHDKCAFCESRFSHAGYGDVEHFRPKAGWVNRDGAPLTRPGYYWLVYEWSNLFICCQLCNQRFKRNLFPLRNPRKRARTHRHALEKETPLLLDPAAVEPATHLGFRDEYAYAISGSLKGQTTIDVMGLNRPELVEVRRDRLQTLKLLHESRRVLAAYVQRDPSSPELTTQLEKIEAELEARVKDSAEYAAMARAFMGTFASLSK